MISETGMSYGVQVTILPAVAAAVAASICSARNDMEAADMHMYIVQTGQNTPRLCLQRHWCRDML